VTFANGLYTAVHAGLSFETIISERRCFYSLCK